MYVKLWEMPKEKNLAKSNPKAFYKYLNSHNANKQSVGPLKDNDTILAEDSEMGWGPKHVFH